MGDSDTDKTPGQLLLDTHTTTHDPTVNLWVVEWLEVVKIWQPQREMTGELTCMMHNSQSGECKYCCKLTIPLHDDDNEWIYSDQI